MITNRMKILKHIIIACGVLMALPAHAERSFQKFVEKHDVDDVTKNLKSDNPADFWTSMLENNQTYQEFREKIATKRGAESLSLNTAQMYWRSYNHTPTLSTQS